MKKLSTFTFLFAAISFWFILQSFQPIDSTESKIQFLKQKLEIAHKAYPNENVYLHIDRPSYWSNDDIWFKAYLESKIDSSNIYVELVGPTGRILQKKMYMAINGIAYGDIHLPDTTSSGVYQIRSYTTWLRNLGESAFYQRNFMVWNIKEKNIVNNQLALESRDIKVQFFPEGGTYITGVSSKLGFKATDENGIGIDIQGVILGDQERFVTFLKSQYKGMGNVIFKPEPNRKYKAIFTFEDRDITIDLPNPEEFGVALNVIATLPDEIRIAISENSQNIDQVKSYYLVGQARGNFLFAKEITLSNGFYGLRISKNSLPTGITQITLFNNELMPLCERLCFVNNNDYVKLDIKPNKDAYSLREEVLIDILSKTKDSVAAIANLSFSAYSTENQLLIEEYPNNILSQFLLNSDIKGRVEEPGYYFKDNEQETLQALDNLMLTQGWRRFSWQAILNNEFVPFNFEHESSIIVKGKVLSKLLEKPLPGSDVTLLFDELAYTVRQQKTDSTGYFYFDKLYFYDETSMIIQVRKQNKKKGTWLELDESSYHSPAVNQLPVAYTVKDNKKVNTTYEISKKDSVTIKRKWHISDTILLDDIDIVGKKFVREFEPSRLYVPLPDKSSVINHEEDIAATVFDYIQFNMPGVFIETAEDGTIVIKVGMGNGPALVLLDGFPTETDLIGSMSFSEFDRIDAQRFAPMYGIKGTNGVINFTTRRDFKNVDRPLPEGLSRMNLQGYAIIREFYSPDYTDAKHSIEKTDFRNTLYWHPNLWTDKDGKAEVKYFNNDQPGEITIVVEGFTADGRICRGVSSYTIKK